MKEIKKTVSFCDCISNTSLDIAQGKSANSSSSLDENLACNANDGKNSTVWCASSGSMPEWWKLDLEENYDLTGISITLAPTSAEFEYKVEVSSDDLSYRVKVDNTSKNNSGTQNYNLTASSVRYIRIIFTGSSTEDWASLSNVNVFGTVSENDDIVPSVTGRVIYHSYYSYGDGSSNLYILNLGTKNLRCISSSWTNVSDPMNAVWSADGKKIVFMGKDNFNDSWDLYSYTIGAGGNPKNLTNNHRSRDEDPKFYPGSNNKIIFKSTHRETYRIMAMDITTGFTSTIYSSNSMECSMPYYSADGLYVYFSGLMRDEAGIYIIPSSGGAPIKVSGCADYGVSEYYPVTKDRTGFFFTRPDPNDIICFKNIQTNARPVIMPFNDLNANNSDACTVNSSYTIISSDRDGGEDGYDLYICSNTTGEAWSLDKYNNGVNTCKHGLGAAYTPITN